MTQKLFIGIDPGLNGAVAAIASDGSVGVYPTESFKAKRGNDFNILWMVGKADAVRAMYDREQCDIFCTIEKQQPYPKQGGASNFKTGKGFGLWLGILAAMQIPYEIVTPQKWKKELLAGTDKSKGAAINKAQALFPGVSLLRTDKCRTPHDGMAEALLIAECGRRMKGGE
jgi:crossover junction endodeoxyribonuclease RuvC